MQTMSWRLMIGFALLAMASFVVVQQRSFIVAADGAPNLDAPPPLAEPYAGAAQAKAEYVGVSNCKMCHSDIHKSWEEKKHARAFELLVAAKQDKNEKCLPCHTTGYGQGGFVDAEKSADLKGITCEACHGPGGNHNGDPSKITRIPPATVCTRCHMDTNIHSINKS
jgi:hypothetical protein